MILRTSPRPTARSLGCLIAAAGLAVAAPALARDDCDIYRLNVPDFDQRRAADPPLISGLPGNGSTHCAPTAVMNWLAYASSNGYPNLVPGGPRDWQSPFSYLGVTMLIDWLGDMMQTDGGTTYTNGFNGLNQWMEAYSTPDEFVVSVPVASGQYAPSPEEIHDLMAAGALLVLCTSGWSIEPETLTPLPGGGIGTLPERFVRTGGGHCVTVVRATDACSNDPSVWFRDPSGFGGDMTDQAPFVTQRLRAEPRPAWYAATPTSTPIYRTMWRFIFPDRPDKNSMINGLYVIIPLMGLDADAQTGEIVVSGLNRADGLVPLPDSTHSTPGGAPIVAMRFLPEIGAAAVLTQAPNGQADLYRFAPGTGRFTRISTFTCPSDPGAVAVGRRGEVYAGAAAGGGGGAGVNVCMGDGSVRFVQIGIPPAALAYDDRSDRLLGVFSDAGGNHALGTFVPLAGPGAATTTPPNPVALTPIPAGVVLGGAVSLVVSPSDGTVFLTSQQSPGVYALVRTGTGTLTLDNTRFTPLPAGATALSVDRAGRLTLTSDGIVRRYGIRTVIAPGNPTPTTAWGDLPQARFAGRPSRGHFQLAVGRAGADDLLPPELDGIDDPREFPAAPIACPPDIDDSGDVTVQDIFAFLSAYFAGDPRADFDRNGQRQPADIFAFLNAYFAGGC